MQGGADQIMWDTLGQGLDRHGTIWDKARTDTGQDEIRRGRPWNRWDRYGTVWIRSGETRERM